MGAPIAFQVTPLLEEGEEVAVVFTFTYADPADITDTHRHYVTLYPRQANELADAIMHRLDGEVA